MFVWCEPFLSRKLWAAVAVLLAYSFQLQFRKNNLPSPVILKGYAGAEFDEVKEIIRQLLAEEREGLAFAVVHKGKVVVDWWGGYADRSSLREWDSETMTCAYSSTKLIGALVFATLVARGEVRYRDKVVKHWPEFGVFGKENLTVQELLEHKSGLVSFCREFSVEEASNVDVIGRLIEQSKPLWEPGKKTGYHALTYGFLVDQLVRRVDRKHRSILRFFEEDVKPLSKEKSFFLSLPKEEEHRMARITNPSLLESVVAHLRRPIRYGEMMYKYWKNGGIPDIAARFPKILSVMETEVLYNNPKIRQLENIASLGFGTSRGFAAAVATFFEEGLFNRTLALVSTPVEFTDDLVLMKDEFRGHGFFYRQHPVRKNEWTVFHGGNGGQMVEVDIRERTVIVLLRNGLRGGSDGEQLYWKASDLILKILSKMT